MLSEMSRSQKDRHWMVPLLGGTRRSPTRRDRTWKGLGGENMGSPCLTGTESQFGKTNAFWKQMVVAVIP